MRIGAGLPARAAQQRAHPSRKFVEVEGFDDVVVSSRIKAANAVLDGVASGCDQHRPFVSPGAQPLQQFQPLQPRQSQVEDNPRMGAGLQGEIGCNAVSNPVHVESGLLQAGLHGVTEQRIVFDEQDAH